MVAQIHGNVRGLDEYDAPYQLGVRTSWVEVLGSVRQRRTSCGRFEAMPSWEQWSLLWRHEDRESGMPEVFSPTNACRRMSGRGHVLPSDLVGRWLRSRTRPELGLGYCTNRQGLLHLTYVDIPDVAEHTVMVDMRELINSPLPIGTRVWLRGKRHGWVAGIVHSAPSGGRYDILLEGGPGKRRKMVLSEDRFQVRWARPLEDPALAIAHGLAEGPDRYEARLALQSQLTEQRRVCRGLTSAISAPIRLFQHQLDTAARVLADPVMRFLLADAVGLGKTIEAGIVIRQCLLDDPEAKILVLCPESLCGQWVSEMRNRLGLGEALLLSRLTVAPHSSLVSYASSGPDGLRDFNLIVLDEAHRCLQGIAPNCMHR